MILERINSPDDLKALPAEELPQLAAEIRELIVSTVATNGGHLASNLGVVELTIALHRVFDSPEDRILFDVSHQSYTHKILTGRGHNFRSLRTTGGYSGYFEPQESPHDVLALGHAGCAPSLALGLAIGERMKGGNGYMVCVIGDGGLTSGPAFEGLSNIIEQHPKNLMVILNDNGMSISKNVGWLAHWRNQWLSRVRTDLEADKDFHQFEESSRNLAPKVPLGRFMLDIGKGVKGSLEKSLIPHAGRIWDELGFNYIGPVEGHNIQQLITAIEQARQTSDKVPFIHVVTTKGAGFDQATNDPVRYHQPGPPSVGPKRPTYSQVFASCLGDLMSNDPRIVAISAAMLEGTALASVQKEFPGRVFDVGISEQHAVSMAAGMARAGLRPVVCIYSSFLQRAFDEIVQDVCINDLPVVFAIDRAGLVGQDGKTHHGLLDMAYMRIIPNMIVSVPSDENELCQLLYTGLRQTHPFSLRYPRGEVTGVPLAPQLETVEIGHAKFVTDGNLLSFTTAKCCLVALGEQVGAAQRAAEMLAEEGIKVTVVDLRFVKPIDPRVVEAVSTFPHAIVIEDGTAVGGAGTAILEAAVQSRGQIPDFHMLAIKDHFPDHGEIAELRRHYDLDAEGIAQQVRNIVNGGDSNA